MEKNFKYQITEELNTQGFSVNPAYSLIERNQGKKDFNTLDYFVIHIIMKEAEIMVDGSKYELPKGNLVFIGPGKNVVFGSGYEHEDNVYVVAFSASFYERSVNDGLLLNSELFFNSSSAIVITPASIPTEEIQKLIIDRLSLYKAKNNKGFYVATAHNCVEALLLDGLLYIEESQTGMEDVKKFTSFDVVNRFRVLLQKNYKKERSVTFYAEHLHISPRRLTDMCEEVLGKSTKHIIIEKIVSESSRMLKYTGLTISEVGYELGFRDEGNFSAFIKKHTGKKPSEIRELN